MCCLPAPLSAPCLLRTHSHHVPCIALECAAVFQLPAAPFHSFHSSPASSICLLPRPPNGHRPPVNTAHAHSTPRVLQQGGYRGAGAAGMKGYRCTRGGGTLEQAAAPHFHSFLMDMFCGGWWEGGKRAEEVVGGCWLLSWVRYRSSTRPPTTLHPPLPHPSVPRLTLSVSFFITLATAISKSSCRARGTTDDARGQKPPLVMKPWYPQARSAASPYSPPHRALCQMATPQHHCRTCVTCTRRSRSANMPASVHTALSSAPLLPVICSAIFFRSMPRCKHWRGEGRVPDQRCFSWQPARGSAGGGRERLPSPSPAQAQPKPSPSPTQLPAPHLQVHLPGVNLQNVKPAALIGVRELCRESRKQEERRARWVVHVLVANAERHSTASRHRQSAARNVQRSICIRSKTLHTGGLPEALCPTPAHRSCGRCGRGAAARGLECRCGWWPSAPAGAMLRTADMLPDKHSAVVAAITGRGGGMAACLICSTLRARVMQWPSGGVPA